MNFSFENYHINIKKLGLDYKTILHHYNKLIVSENKQSFIKIIDTCRLNNKQILPLTSYSHLDVPIDEIIAFVPAAGACSRYTHPLEKLRQAMEISHNSNVGETYENLKKIGLQAWKLPFYLRQIINQRQITENSYKNALEEFKLPKAFFPCVTDHKTFLHMKSQEHNSLETLYGQIFVSPPCYREYFLKHLQKNHPTNHLSTLVLEQDSSLTTLRFQEDHQPYLDHQNCLSTVPSGHGALLSLLPQVKKFSASGSLFIRNIDNINGCSETTKKTTNNFFKFHCFLLNEIKKIRINFKKQNILIASKIADNLLKKILNKNSYNPTSWGQYTSLVELQESLFYTVLRKNLSQHQLHKHLHRLYQRPVHTMGMVPNSGTDRGGSPVIAETTDYGRIKLCVEQPHISPQDRENLIDNIQIATHFNPVFILAEIPKRVDYYKQYFEHPFWLISQKCYRGKPVRYYESLLCELLGNSFMSNLVFVEIPRLLFHPVKHFADLPEMSFESWFTSP